MNGTDDNIIDNLENSFVSIDSEKALEDEMEKELADMEVIDDFEYASQGYQSNGSPLLYQKESSIMNSDVDGNESELDLLRNNQMDQYLKRMKDKVNKYSKVFDTNGGVQNNPDESERFMTEFINIRKEREEEHFKQCNKFENELKEVKEILATNANVLKDYEPPVITLAEDNLGDYYGGTDTEYEDIEVSPTQKEKALSTPKGIIMSQDFQNLDEKIVSRDLINSRKELKTLRKEEEKKKEMKSEKRKIEEKEIPKFRIKKRGKEKQKQAEKKMRELAIEEEKERKRREFEEQMRQELEQIQMGEEDRLSKRYEEFLDKTLYEQMHESVPHSNILTISNTNAFFTEKPLPTLRPSITIMEDHFERFSLPILQKPTPQLISNTLKAQKQRIEKYKEDKKLQKDTELKQKYQNRLSTFLNSPQSTSQIFQKNQITHKNTNLSKKQHKLKQHTQTLIINKVKIWNTQDYFKQNKTELSYPRIPALNFPTQFLHRLNQFKEQFSSISAKLKKLVPKKSSFPQRKFLPYSSSSTSKHKLDVPEHELFNELEKVPGIDTYNSIGKLSQSAGDTEGVEIKLTHFVSIKGVEKYINARKLTVGMTNLPTINTSDLEKMKKLRELYLSQNKITHIPPDAFKNLKELKILHMDVNLLQQIDQTINDLHNLEVLKLDNNRIKEIKNIDNLVKLTQLNLYRNKITKIQNLDKLLVLELLDLGRNLITDISYLCKGEILPLLMELMLYYNQITNIPQDFSFLLLKKLWLNGNQINNTFSIKFAPLLQMLNVSDNKLETTPQLQFCINLRNFDVSFNNIQKIYNLVQGVMNCKFLECFKYNDNPLENERVGAFIPFVQRGFPLIKEINDNKFEPNLQKVVSFHEQHLEPKFINKNIESFKSIINLSRFIILERGFYSRITNSRLRKTNIYFKELPKMEYFQRFLPFLHWNQILHQKFQVNSFEIIKNLSNLNKCRAILSNETNAIKKIQAFLLRPLLKKKILLRVMKKNVPKLIKIQTNFRGYATRKKLCSSLKSLKEKALKRRPDYKAAVKIQAHVKGFLLRTKIKKALKKINYTGISDEFEEIDIDNFLNINESDFQQDLIIPEPEIFEQLFQQAQEQNQITHPINRKPERHGLGLLTNGNKENNSKDYSLLPPLPQKPAPSHTSTITPSINGKGGDSSPLHLPALNKQNIAKILPKSYPYTQDPKRPPTATTSNLTEIELQSANDTLRTSSNSLRFAQLKNQYYHLLNPTLPAGPYMTQEDGSDQLFESGQIQSRAYMKNNDVIAKINSITDSYGNQSAQKNKKMDRMWDGKDMLVKERNRVIEEKKEIQHQNEKVCQDWGFESEQSRKILEARLMKIQQRKNKNKNKNLTADQKFQRFLMQKELSRKNK